jgi:hypothetical protein
MRAIFTEAEAAHKRRLLNVEVQPVSYAQLEYEDARRRFLRSLDLDDITNEFDEVSLELMKGDDANAIGRHVIALRNAWADRLAAREVYGSNA